MRAILERIFGKYDPMVFYPFAILLIFGVIAMAISPEGVGNVFNAITNFTLFKMGWFVQLLAIVVIISCFYLMCSRFGDIKMGLPGDKPEFSNMSWISMMFCAGFGMTMWMWCAGEIFLSYVRI